MYVMKKDSLPVQAAPQVGCVMEMLENLAELMLQTPFRFEQAEKRQLEYDKKKADEAGLALDQYRAMLRRQKVRHMVQECIFGETDDIILFADCWKSFGITPDVEASRARAKAGYCHDHDYFEMFYVLKGSCYNYINGQEELFQEGSVCMMNFQTAHERVLADEDSMILTICVRKKVFTAQLLNMLRDIPMFWQFYASSVSNENQAAACIHLQDTPNHHLESIIYQMLRAYLMNDETSQTVMKCYLIPLLAEMARIHCVKGFNSEPRLTPRNPSLEAVLETIQAKCGMVTLQELAEENHFSLNYLSRLIRETTGKTFKELSSYYWQEKAKTLLQCTPLNIDEIAELMGFSSRANFERRFKALVAVSPAQFRQRT